MAAILACGPHAALSHTSAAELWGIAPARRAIEVSVPENVSRIRPGVAVHRHVALNVTRRNRIPVTTPICTIVDLATRLDPHRLERLINEADKLDLIDAGRLWAAVTKLQPRPGVARLRKLLERHAFTITDTVLEQRFLPIARSAGLTPPRTQQRVNGFKVDFYWPELGLVVETDGLRYHRTAAQQTADRLRDQAHAAAGLTPLRFTRWQVVFEPDHVRATLAAVSRRAATRRTS